MDVARTRTGIKLRCTDIDILEDDMDDGNKTGMIRIPIRYRNGTERGKGSTYG